MHCASNVLHHACCWEHPPASLKERTVVHVRDDGKVANAVGREHAHAKPAPHKALGGVRACCQLLGVLLLGVLLLGLALCCCRRRAVQRRHMREMWRWRAVAAAIPPGPPRRRCCCV